MNIGVFLVIKSLSAYRTAQGIIENMRQSEMPKGKLILLIFEILRRPLMYMFMLFIYFYQCPMCGSDWWDLKLSWQLKFYDLRQSLSGDVPHTDPACQLQQEWTDWWWDRFMLDCWRPWTWGLDDIWTVRLTDYKACGWKLGSRFQSSSLNACAVCFNKMSEHGEKVAFKNIVFYFCLWVFAASI